ncbi:glycosyl transferase family protein [Qipengyuania sp. RANM35]|uniref:glycosyl transferase family protein n=1 Tax=Qipengyuania sp. RANM35 TaxID=3068635 RepID=UPI0034DB348A
MDFYQISGEQWYLLFHRELLLFTAAFFAVGVVDEFALDLSYLWMRITGRISTPHIRTESLPQRLLAGDAAIFIPAWQESSVIGPTIAHLLASWGHDNLRLYVGCYRNDPLTIASVVASARGDNRVRLVIHGEDGPTSKADCLNRLYRALCDDEARYGREARMVVLHDAEDMVDPAALALLDLSLWRADFVQLPVMALPQSNSRFIGSHYSDEFAEAHAKSLVVRDALGAAIPGAGVGCAVARKILARMGPEPFARQSLTEDYELGLKIAALGGKGRFLRARASDGRLIATRAFFPSRLDVAVRQKTRWMHGIALQGWDRLGWRGTWVDLWMQMRDRRGPLAAILLASAYLLIAITAAGWLASGLGIVAPSEYSPLLGFLLLINVLGLAARSLSRAVFTAREFGWRQGLLAIPRVVVSNIISIMAGRRALGAYIKTLRGGPVTWDKTDHSDHPAMVPWRELVRVA